MVQGLEWKTHPDGTATHQVARLTVTGAGVGFRQHPGSDTGILFTNVLTDVKLMVNQNLMNGSGLAVGDYDGDGLCDIYFTNLNEGNALYRNLGGWKFRDVTTEAGVDMVGMNATGATFADTDGDGDLDLLVNTMGSPNVHYQNNGNGTFTPRRDYPGMANKMGSTSMALGDVDGDGDLDLYVTNFGVQSIIRSGGLIKVTYRNGQPVVRGRYADRIKIIDGKMYELGEEDYFYLNNGTGGFKPQSFSGGRFRDETGKRFRSAPLDQGLCVSFRDLNGDSAPDIYICNDAFTPDRFYLNDGKGNFTEIDPLKFRKTPFFSMGADFADIDRDGDDDFIVVDMLSRRHVERMTQRGSMPPRPTMIGSFVVRDQVRRNNFYLNRGDGSFAEVANFSNVAASGWSWSPIFIDVDLDGWEDLLVTNGFQYDVDDQDAEEAVTKMNLTTLTEQRRAVLEYPPLDSPNYAFRNLRNLRFEENGTDWGFDNTAVSNGMALGDMDNDGDLDVVISTSNSQALVYENIGVAPRIAIRLKGKAPNTFGVGARITLEGGPVTQTQEMMAGGRYMSGDGYMRVFAATPGRDHTAIIDWRDGKRTRVTGLQANHAYILSADGNAIPVDNEDSDVNSEPDQLFTDVSGALNHTHREVVFDDFARQPLLPRKMSQAGPAIAVGDFDGNGSQDIAIGASRGHQTSVAYSSVSADNSVSFDTDEIGDVLADDTLGLIGVRESADQTGDSLYIATSEYETLGGKTIMKWEPSGAATVPFVLESGSGGTLAATDLDGDGDIDFISGGALTGASYPQCSPLTIHLNEQGKYSTIRVPTEGVIRGITTADLDSDGFPEIIAAHEWGRLEIFSNSHQSGTFENVSVRWGTDRMTGLWHSVLATDVNNDGLIDLVAGNWGLNDHYSSEGMKPMHLYFTSTPQGGGIPIVEAYTEPADGRLLPYRDRMMTSRIFPEIVRTVASHRAYGESTVDQIYQSRWNSFKKLTAVELRSSVFLNTGESFEVKPLPAPAQFTPVFGIVAEDWNGDGNVDLFLAQNFFQQHEDAPKLEAGRGLLLKGLGDGDFSEVPAKISGIEIHGEQRGAASGDFNNDGRPDLVVSQNASTTRLFLNSNSISKPGRPLYLTGPAGNPDALGASVITVWDSGASRVFPIGTGGGYYSHSGTQVHPIISNVAGIRQISVVWPGGRRTTHNGPFPGTGPIELSSGGK